MDRSNEVQLAALRRCRSAVRQLGRGVRSLHHVQALTGPHAVAAQLGEELGCVLRDGQVPSVGGAPDQQDIENLG